MGIRVQPIDESVRRRFGIPARQGMAITQVQEGSYLDRIGVAPGDVIVQLDDQHITTEKAFADAVINSRLKSAILMLVQRSDRVYSLTVRLSP